MTLLELLSPARNLEIGIAAIDCGADAVYIGGPSFGARHDAGNSVEDIRSLVEYAHKFGVRVFVTVNTIIYEEEIPTVRALLRSLGEIGVDALIVQDLAVVKLCREEGLDIPLHASTQCAIRTPERACFYEGAGFSRLVLERQLSLGEIRSIRDGVEGELEFFVHGALCTSYSGQCYLSEFLSGRSANRGECIQACRSLYDLVDEDGNLLAKDRALLSLKDYNLKDRLKDLADAGICSFKIEGRLKNISYVKNVVREYSLALDSLVKTFPEKYSRSSYGRVEGGFAPDPSKTFNRGYTSLYIDGKRGPWASFDTPRSVGEKLGKIESVKPAGKGVVEVKVAPFSSEIVPRLSNGDGFSVVSSSGISGFRGDVCQGLRIRTHTTAPIRPGMILYRNYSSEFERTLQSSPCRRVIEVSVAAEVKLMSKGQFSLSLLGIRPDGERAGITMEGAFDLARDPQRMYGMLDSQISKRTLMYSFLLDSIVMDPSSVPNMPASFINSARRALAGSLSEIPCLPPSMYRNAAGEKDEKRLSLSDVSYKENVSNSISRGFYEECGATCIEKAFELEHKERTELMRSRYCLRYELGLCLRGKDGGASLKEGREKELYLLNNGRRLHLRFDCRRCEMVVEKG